MLALAEPETRDARVRPHPERLAGGTRIVVGGGMQLVEDAQAARLLVLEGAPDRFADLRLPRRRCLRQQFHQVRAGEVLAEAVGGDHERVEQSAVALVAGELNHVHAPVELGESLEVVIGLGVDVDHEAAAPFSLEGEQLGGDRLARPERPGEQDRRRSPGPRRLGDIEAHRAGAAGQRAADVDAALRPGLMGADRHQRAELLDRQHVGVVAHDPAVRPRQMVEEQRGLQAERAVQRDRPEPVSQRLDALLEQLRRGRADGQ